jgi:hypothetical protein
MAVEDVEGDGDDATRIRLKVLGGSLMAMAKPNKANEH